MKIVLNEAYTTFDIGDIVCVKSGRALPIGTVGKIIDIKSEAYGGAYRDENGVSHALSGSNNETCYLYLDVSPRRVRDVNCVAASKSDIERYNQVVKDSHIVDYRYLGDIGDKITFKATIIDTKTLTFPDGDSVYQYSFETDDAQLVLGYSKEKFSPEMNSYTGIVKQLKSGRGNKKVTVIKNCMLTNSSSASSIVMNPSSEIGDTVEFTTRCIYVFSKPNAYNAYRFNAENSVYLLFTPAELNDNAVYHIKATIKDVREYGKEIQLILNRPIVIKEV